MIALDACGWRCEPNLSPLRCWFGMAPILAGKRLRQPIQHPAHPPFDLLRRSGATSGLSTNEKAAVGLRAATIEPPPSRSMTSTLQGRRTPMKGSPVIAWWASSGLQAPRMM